MNETLIDQAGDYVTSKLPSQKIWAPVVYYYANQVKRSDTVIHGNDYLTDVFFNTAKAKK